MLGEKENSHKRTILYDSTYMRYLESSQIHKDRKQKGGCQMLGEGEWAVNV